MARSVNYAAKIEKLEEKISKKKAELDRLQEELKVLKQKKDEHDYGADHASSFVSGREQYEAKLDEMLEKTQTVTA